MRPCKRRGGSNAPPGNFAYGFSPVKRLGQYHRWILFGGATVFSVVLLTAAAIAISVYTNNLIHAQRLLFSGEQRQAEVRVIAANARMRQTAAKHEALHAIERHGFGQQLFATRRTAETAAIQSGLPAPEAGIAPSEMKIITSLTEAQSPEELADLLDILYDILPSAITNTAPEDLGKYFMLYDSSKSFLGLHVPKNVLPAIQTPTDPDRIHARIADIVAPIEAALNAVPGAQLQAGKTVWIGPYADELTGKRLISRASVIFHGEHRFSVLVISAPLDQFDQHFLLHPLPPNFAIVAADGTVLSGTASAHTIAQAIAPGTAAAQGPASLSGRIRAVLSDTHPLLTLTHPIGDTGWTIVDTFDWSALWNEMRGEFLFIPGIALALSLILWTAVILFNRKIFIPVLTEALRVHDSEAFNRAMMTVAPLGFFVLNYRSGEIMLENDQARAMAAGFYPPSDTRPLHEHVMARYKAEDGQRTGRADHHLTPAVIELPGPDGVVSYALAFFTRTRYLSHDVLLCCLSDITAQKLAERALLQAKTEADQANMAKSTFLALISHEIRTPLHGASGHLELLESADLPEAELELVKIIRHSFRSLLKIINEILDISKIEAGKLKLDCKRFNLRETVDRCCHLWRPALDKKSIAFECHIAAATPREFIGDDGRIEQVINNLLSNAVKFTDSGSVSVDIRPESRAEDCMVHIVVRDTGIGIAPQDQKNLCVPFSQAHTGITKKFGGTGLGLSLCKQLVEAMRGRLRIHSEPGAGTAVHIELPLSLPSAESAARSMSSTAGEPAADAPHRASAASPRTNIFRVLAAEDDPVSRHLLSKQLSRLGDMQVDFVDDGRQALALATSDGKRGRYDLILTDLCLPHLSGYELVRALREHGLSAPIVVMSASVPDDQTLALLPDVDAILTKPVSLLQLRNTLSRHAPMAIATRKKRGASKRKPAQPANAGQTESIDADAAAIFLDTYFDDLLALRRASRSGDTQAMTQQLHRLKGALLVMCEQGLAARCESLWQEIRLTAAVPTRPAQRQFVKELLRAVRRIRAAALHRNEPFLSPSEK
ncbi:MAG: multi-sensor hybrid histidine kinase [Herbaspirillum sp.]|nr:multi-sensor hybrid histidine kinase [Herbaspirillum sp.]